jgi:hypothetical protein
MMIGKDIQTSSFSFIGPLAAGLLDVQESRRFTPTQRCRLDIKYLKDSIIGEHHDLT